MSGFLSPKANILRVSVVLGFRSPKVNIAKGLGCVRFLVFLE